MKIKYPKKFKSKVDGLVVEFCGLTLGTVIDSGTSVMIVGSTLDTWISHTCTDNWEEVIEMLDTTKQYTYYGNPARIYADGSDTYRNYIHIAYLKDCEWACIACSKNDLVEVWQPTEGELVYMFDDKFICVTRYKFTTVDGRHIDKHNEIWKYIAPFTGTLPVAFKGVL